MLCAYRFGGGLEVRSSILRVVGTFLKVDVAAPPPVPAIEPCLGAAGPAISSMLRTAGAEIAVPAFCPIEDVVGLAGARVCVVLPSRMFMTSRRSSSSADSRDMLTWWKQVNVSHAPQRSMKDERSKQLCWATKLRSVADDQGWVGDDPQQPLPVMKIVVEK